MTADYHSPHGEDPNTAHADAPNTNATDAPTGATGTEDHTGAQGPSVTEEFTVSGKKLLGKVKDLIAEGNVRSIILRNEGGRTLLEIPLNAGVAATAAAALFAPALVAVGAIAALVTSVSITVVRDPNVPANPVAHDDHDGDRA